MGKLPDKENKEVYVRNLFNSIAGRYDLINTLMSFGMDKPWRRFTVKRAAIKPGGNGLDICCGTGMLTMEQAKVTGKDGHVTGLDFSEKMLGVARQNIQEFVYRDTITLIQGNAMSLPFPDNSFDCVTVGWGLRNVPDILTVMKEMKRVVKPGGKVVSLDMAQPEFPVFKQVYWLFFDKVIPAIGKVWAGQKWAYSYLHDSAKVFPHQKILTKMMAEAGFVEAQYHNLLLGVVAVVEGRKPLEGE